MKILVVDDEPMIRELAAKILNRAGFDVAEAASGSEGIAAIQHDPGQFDLLLLDLTLGDISGLDVLSEARRLLPNLPAILSSGNLMTTLELPDHLATHTRYLEKPYRSSQLSDLVKELLAL